MTTAERTRASRRAVAVVGWAFVGCSLVLVPWTAYLAITLPDHATAAHVALAWSGFDVMLLVAVVWVAVTALRGSRWLPHAASVTATLLVVDAWFDVVTSASPGQLWEALGMALAVELPLALVCVWLTVTGQSLAEHRIARTLGPLRPRQWTRERTRERRRPRRPTP